MVRATKPKTKSENQTKPNQIQNDETKTISFLIFISFTWTICPYHRPSACHRRLSRRLPQKVKQQKLSKRTTIVIVVRYSSTTHLNSFYHRIGSLPLAHKHTRTSTRRHIHKAHQHRSARTIVIFPNPFFIIIYF